MSPAAKEKEKLLIRVRRIRGQVEAIERAIGKDGENEQLLQLVASCRGALNGLMAGLIEDHLRLRVLPQSSRKSPAQAEAAEELLTIVKRYFH